MSLGKVTFGVAAVALVLGSGFLWRDYQRTAPMKQVITEFERYKTAVQTFHDQYDALPGDMASATDIWGLAGGLNGVSDECYATDSRQLENPKKTCDGNGNGHLFYKDNSAGGSAPEWYRSWQHLSNAGLIEGSFSGHRARHPRGAKVGENVPEAQRVPEAGYTLMSFFHLTHPKWFPGDYFGLAFGRPFINPLQLPVESRGPAVRPDQAIWLDQKIDDGSPRTGVVRSYRDLKGCVELRGGDYVYRTEVAEPSCGLFLAFDDPGFGDMKPQ